MRKSDLVGAMVGISISGRAGVKREDRMHLYRLLLLFSATTYPGSEARHSLKFVHAGLIFSVNSRVNTA